ncbi:hypothetical protein BH10ACI1_BH10ACI1_30060 [soil metagenome]
MPPKIRELIANLERQGFINRGSKESHKNYEYILGFRVTVFGEFDDAAHKYQEKFFKDAIGKLKSKVFARSEKFSFGDCLVEIFGKEIKYVDKYEKDSGLDFGKRMKLG